MTGRVAHRMARRECRLWHGCPADKRCGRPAAPSIHAVIARQKQTVWLAFFQNPERRCRPVAPPFAPALPARTPTRSIK
ncbi:hypothetical protein EMIT0111MI5_11132 [Burkholderia sp. IT-111MI5]